MTSLSAPSPPMRQSPPTVTHSLADSESTGAVAAGPRVRRPELRALTGLRAVAALAVVASHVGAPKNAPEAITKILQWGYIGVPLFFMLSGVVLAYNYPRLTIRQTRRTIKFYVARIARIMPLYWVMIAYSAALYFSVNHRQYPGAFVQNVFAVQTWGGDLLVAQSYYNGPGWSIGVELFFYLLFPFIVPVIAAIDRRWRARGLIAVITVAALIIYALCAFFVITGRAALPAADPGSAHRWLYRNPLCHLPLFVAGLAIAFLLPYVKHWSTRTQHILQSVVLAYVLGLAVFRGNGGFWGAASYSAFFVVPFTVALLSLSSDRGWFARFLATRPMVTLGLASFALYLTHRWFVWQLSTYESVAKGHDFTPYVGYIATVAVLLLIAEGAHRYIEEPGRRVVVALGNRLARNSPTRPQPAAPPMNAPPRQSLAARI